MRFFQTVLASAALVASAMAKIELNSVPTSVQAGQTYDITFSGGDSSPATLVLRKGDSGNLATIATITTTATGGKFTWSVDPALPNANDYAIEIRQGADNNYSGKIALSGSNASAISSAVSSAVSSALSSASSAASSAASSLASTLTTTASAGMSTSVGSNTTITTGSLSASKTAASTTKASASASGSSSGGAPASTGAASVLGSSPLALIFGAVAAMAL